MVVGILLACKDKSASSSSLKIEALTFLRAAMENSSPAVFQPHVQQLSQGVFTAASERYYKVGCLDTCCYGLLSESWVCLHHWVQSSDSSGTGCNWYYGCASEQLQSKPMAPLSAVLQVVMGMRTQAS